MKWSWFIFLKKWKLRGKCCDKSRRCQIYSKMGIVAPSSNEPTITRKKWMKINVDFETKLISNNSSIGWNLDTEKNRLVEPAWRWHANSWSGAHFFQIFLDCSKPKVFYCVYHNDALKNIWWGIIIKQRNKI